MGKIHRLLLGAEEIGLKKKYKHSNQMNLRDFLLHDLKNFENSGLFTFHKLNKTYKLSQFKIVIFVHIRQRTRIFDPI